MKLSQHNKFVRFILRAIDVVVSFRTGRRVNWNEDPFQKASEAEKRIAGLFMALFPISFLIMLKNIRLVDSWISSMLHSSVVWLYLVFISAICFALLIAFKVAPKIPLILSVPIAIVAWSVFLWFAWTHVI